MVVRVVLRVSIEASCVLLSGVVEDSVVTSVTVCEVTCRSTFVLFHFVESWIERDVMLLKCKCAVVNVECKNDEGRLSHAWQTVHDSLNSITDIHD